LEDGAAHGIDLLGKIILCIKILVYDMESVISIPNELMAVLI
jgi:hypothetical protein